MVIQRNSATKPREINSGLPLFVHLTAPTIGPAEIEGWRVCFAFMDTPVHARMSAP